MADVLAGVALLDDSGVPGPYALLLDPARYYAYLEAITPGGYPAARQLAAAVSAVHRAATLPTCGALVSGATSSSRPAGT